MSFVMPTRALAVTGAAALLVLAPALSAQAHVRVVPESTAGGGFTKLTFRVPTESDTAGTVKLVVDLPTATPLAFVSVQPVPGWEVKVERSELDPPVTVHGAQITEAPTRVTWTAEQGTAIAPGEFEEFALSAGPLPDSGDLAFPAAQTYSDGEVVAWDQPVPASGEEPERPVPGFAVTAADSGAGSGADASGTPPAASGDDVTARWLGGAGLAAGLTGLGLGALGLRAGSRRSTAGAA